MKTKNFLLAMCFVTILCSRADAQIQVGFKAGYNVANINYLFKTDVHKLLSIQSIPLTQVSIPVEIMISNHYSIQPELHFKQSGNSIKVINSPFPLNNFINYWGLGAMNKFKYEAGNVTPYALLGFQFNLATNGELSYLSPDAMNTFEDVIKEKIDFEELDLGRFDMVFRAGLGLSMQVRKAALLFELTYDKGMIDIDKSDTLSAYNEQGIGIMIGIMKNFSSE